jgi:hypothetical protein
MAFDLKIGGMRKLNQREIGLVALAGVIAIFALSYFLRGEGGLGFAGPQSRFTAEEARAEVGSQLRVPPIDLALLEETSDAFENLRNLFAYGQNRQRNSGTPPPSLTEPPAGPPVIAGGTKTPEEKAADLAAEAAVEAAKLPDPPEMNLKFVGFIGPPAEKTVFLIDEEAEENYIGGVGEAIAGQFRILEIGYEYIEIGYTDPIFEGQSERVILAEWSEEEEKPVDKIHR